MQSLASSSSRAPRAQNQILLSCFIVIVFAIAQAHAIDYTLQSNCFGYDWNGLGCVASGQVASVPVGSHTVTIGGTDILQHPVAFTTDTSTLALWSGLTGNVAAGLTSGTYAFTVLASDVGLQIYYQCVIHRFFGTLNLVAATGSSTGGAVAASSTGVAAVGSSTGVLRSSTGVVIGSSTGVAAVGSSTGVVIGSSTGAAAGVTGLLSSSGAATGAATGVSSSSAVPTPISSTGVVSNATCNVVCNASQQICDDESGPCYCCPRESSSTGGNVLCNLECISSLQLCFNDTGCYCCPIEPSSSTGGLFCDLTCNATSTVCFNNDSSCYCCLLETINITLSSNCFGYSWDGQECSCEPEDVTLGVGIYYVEISGSSILRHPVVFSLTSNDDVELWSGATPNPPEGITNGTVVFNVTEEDRGTAIYYRSVNDDIAGRLWLVAVGTIPSSTGAGSGSEGSGAAAVIPAFAALSVMSILVAVGILA